MTTLQRTRLIAGFLISPLVLPLLVYITFLIVFGLQNYNSETTLTSLKTIIWLNHLIALVMGVPAYFILRAKGLATLRNYTLGGFFLGLILITLISHNFVYLFYIVFSLAGSLVGATFWYIALYQPVRIRRRSRRSRRRYRG